MDINDVNNRVLKVEKELNKFKCENPVGDSKLLELQKNIEDLRKEMNSFKITLESIKEHVENLGTIK